MNKCPRNRKDCKPIETVMSVNGKTFTCCGFNEGTTRLYEQDIFTHCWKTETTNDMSHMDERDMIHTIFVMSSALFEWKK